MFQAIKIRSQLYLTAVHVSYNWLSDLVRVTSHRNFFPEASYHNERGYELESDVY